jgi:beta-galactosidase GanA
VSSYATKIATIIAKAQVTEGGPVILYQPENEYTSFCCGQKWNGAYMQYVINRARNSGIAIPMITNDAGPYGNDAPGSGVGAVDIYGHDAYP